MKYYPLILIFIACGCFNYIVAQTVNDTIKKEIDSKEQTIKKHSPHKAAVYSALLPGAGQFYNKKYWKMPIIYAGFGSLIYFINLNAKEYNNYKTAYSNRTNNIDDKYSNYSLDNLRQFKNYYRGNMELSIMLSGLLYMINIIDASVDAHFFDYDVSDNLSLNVRPDYINIKDDKSYAVTLTLKF